MWFTKLFGRPLVDRKGKWIVARVTREEFEMVRIARAIRSRFIPEQPIVVSQEGDAIRAVLQSSAEKRANQLGEENRRLRAQLSETTSARDDLLRVLKDNLNCGNAGSTLHQG